MYFEINHQGENEVYIKVLDDAGKHIGNTMIRCFIYGNRKHLKQKLKHENTCTRKACLQAAKHIPEPGIIAYVGLLELDYRERGKGYGPQILQHIPQLCKKFQGPTPDVACAYILPHYHQLDIETYQHQALTKKEHRKMRKIMHKAFRRAGYKQASFLAPQIVVKRLVKS